MAVAKNYPFAMFIERCQKFYFLQRSINVAKADFLHHFTNIAKGYFSQHRPNVAKNKIILNFLQCSINVAKTFTTRLDPMSLKEKKKLAFSIETQQPEPLLSIRLSPARQHSRPLFLPKSPIFPVKLLKSVMAQRR